MEEAASPHTPRGNAGAADAAEPPASPSSSAHMIMSPDKGAGAKGGGGGGGGVGFGGLGGGREWAGAGGSQGPSISLSGTWSRRWRRGAMCSRHMTPSP